MSREFTCPYCLFTGRLPGSFAGGRVKCPSCKNSIPVPRPDEAPAAADPPVEPPPPVESPPVRPPVEARATEPPAEVVPPPELPVLVPVPFDEPEEIVPMELDEEPEDTGRERRLIWAGVAAAVLGLLVLTGVGAVVVSWLAGPPKPMAVAQAPLPSPPQPVAEAPGPGTEPAGRAAQPGVAGAPPAGAVPPRQGYPGMVPPWAMGPRNVPPGTFAPGLVPPWVPDPKGPPNVAPAARPADLLPAPAAAGPDVADVGPAKPRVGPAPADPPAPNAPAATLAEIVRKVKDATVYLKVRSGTDQGTGTGFVVRVEPGVVYVATNDHVVRLSDSPPGDSDPALPRSQVTAVFRSGDPSGKEVTLPAQVLACDREENRDLAVLRVVGLANPPEPVDLARWSTPTETMAVTSFGFPFGDLNQMIDRTSRQNPSLTVGRGTVSRLQYDESSKLSFVQIDGSINPGNSGGPVVDDLGRLVGVAVAKVANTNIGFAVPAPEVSRLLAGRAGRLKIGLTPAANGGFEMRASAGVIDPLSRVRSVELLVGPESGPVRAGADGDWAEITSNQRVTLDRRGPSAEGLVQSWLAWPGELTLRFQACVRDLDGKVSYGKPLKYVIPPRPGRVTTVAGGPAPPAAAQAVADLVLTDPSRSAKLRRDGDSVILDVAMGVHVLGPEAALAARQAPMALKEVEGDFAIQVQVTGALLPGSEPPKVKGHALPNTYQGAGLVLFEDRRNYLRIERSGSGGPGRPDIASEVVIEVCDNGRIAGPYVQSFPEGPLFLRIERFQYATRCMFGPDGNVWAATRQLAVAFPAKVKVGLIASNASKESLSARFEHLSLTKP